MVDQAWAEGGDPTGGALHYERSSSHRRLQAFETGGEAFMTGGWVRVLVTPEQLARERAGMEHAARQGSESRDPGSDHHQLVPYSPGRQRSRGHDRCHQSG